MNVNFLQKSVLSDLQSSGPPQDTAAPAYETIRAEPLATSAGRAPQQAIEQTVAGPLNEGRPENENRWEPRLPFVRPVSISFKLWPWVTQRELSELEFQEATFRLFPTEIAAVSTDISQGGIGIVSRYDGLPSRVTLEVEGAVFACEVCWSERIDGLHYRHGLRFQEVLDKSGSNW